MKIDRLWLNLTLLSEVKAPTLHTSCNPARTNLEDGDMKLVRNRRKGRKGRR